MELNKMALIRITSVFTVALLAGLSFSSAAFSASRSSVAGDVGSACSSDEASCLSAVSDKIASLQGCSVDALNTSKGLADATVLIGKTNAGLALKIAELVALKGSSCAQVAFGGVLDGTGTASIGKKKIKTGSAG
jgi:hypothetical protein